MRTRSPVIRRSRSATPTAKPARSNWLGGSRSGFSALSDADTGGDPAGWYRERFERDADYSVLLEELAAEPGERQRLLRAYAREPLPWGRKWRYRIGRLLCGRRPFAPHLDRERWESELQRAA